MILAASSNAERDHVGVSAAVSSLQPETDSDGRVGHLATPSPVSPPKSDGAPTERNGATVATGWKKILFLILAGGTFVLGVLGAILPGLPTTPFLLLTSYFLVRSSPRLNQTLLKSRFFGPILTDWQIHGGVRRDVKLQAITIVVLIVAATVYFSGRSTLFNGIVVGVASFGIAVILRLPAPHSRSDDKIQQSE